MLQIWFARKGTKADDAPPVPKGKNPKPQLFDSMSENHVKTILRIYDFDGEKERAIKKGWGYFRCGGGSFI